jgi:hypothetical protein
MKYIVVEYRGCELPIIFDPILGHNEVAPIVGGVTVLGAGEVNFRTVVVGANPDPTDETPITVGCWGQSTSLGIKSRGAEDAKLIERMVNPYD